VLAEQEKHYYEENYHLCKCYATPAKTMYKMYSTQPYLSSEIILTSVTLINQL